MSCGLFDAPPAAFAYEESGRRYYRLLGTGEIVPSISTVAGLLSRDGLVRWSVAQAVEHLQSSLMASVGRRLKLEALAAAVQEARQRPTTLARSAAMAGRQVHQAAQALAVGGELPPEATSLPADWDGLMRWLHDHQALWHSEVVVCSRSMRVAGQCDLAGLLDDLTLAVYDLKTSDAVYESHRLQVSAYAAALAEMGWQVSEVGVLLLPRGGPFEAVTLPDWQRYAAAFRHVAAAWHLLRERGDDHEWP